jgi:hypothetical protein
MTRTMGGHIGTKRRVIRVTGYACHPPVLAFREVVQDGLLTVNLQLYLLSDTRVSELERSSLQIFAGTGGIRLVQSNLERIVSLADESCSISTSPLDIFYGVLMLSRYIYMRHIPVLIYSKRSFEDKGKGVTATAMVTVIRWVWADDFDRGRT